MNAALRANFLQHRLQHLQHQSPAALASINGTRRIAIDTPISRQEERQEEPD